MADISLRARSFGAQAELYDRLRPRYPDPAVDAALPHGARRVADVGAGTGKLTASLLARGLEVVAVEPDAGMRAVLAARLPAADVREGVGERLPLPDASVDAVTYAQAWHWTQVEAAAREAHRVIAGAGTLAMLWNVHLDDVGWVAELNRVTDSAASASALSGPPPMAGFAPGRRTDTRWEQHMTRGELVDLSRTWSSVATLPDADREGVLAAVRRLLDADPALSGREQVALPYLCSTWAYTRLPEQAAG